jgi:hypothetical protein
MLSLCLAFPTFCDTLLGSSWAGALSVWGMSVKPPESKRSKKYRCPACHAKAGVKIYYGFPDIEFFKDMDEADYELGGCMGPMVLSDGTCVKGTRHCKSCGHEWCGSYKSAVNTLHRIDQ